MTRDRKGPPRPAKHFQHDDHAHAAHQADAAPGQAQHPGHGQADRNTEGRKRGHPADAGPQGSVPKK